MNFFKAGLRKQYNGEKELTLCTNKCSSLVLYFRKARRIVYGNYGFILCRVVSLIFEIAKSDWL